MAPPAPYDGPAAEPATADDLQRKWLVVAANCVGHEARGYAVLAQERIGRYPASGPAQALWGGWRPDFHPKRKCAVRPPQHSATADSSGRAYGTDIIFLAGIPRDESLG